MREGEGTTATAQRENITTTTTIRTEAWREHCTMTSTGTTGDTAIGTETEKYRSTMIGGIGDIIVREIDTLTTTKAGPIPVPDPGLL